ncbi:MarR family winged helix-turn-helix transcriptional regulator [Pseudarthrobacter sp. DSP2-3-2b1]|uniref:MarR family winged helix-turn-helix transcriptional regulator n=1 Tax=Pseudarthrobacter sp. DSP2-3-2b1 TaxID=2804661 RepID=UPI003CF987F5
MTDVNMETMENRNAAAFPASDHLLASELVSETEFLAARTISIGTTRANEMLAPLDLKVRPYSVLALATTADGPTQREMADFLCLAPSQIVALVDDLEQRGLVERLNDPNDRRSKVIRATVSGKTLYKRARESVRQAEDISLQELTAEERDQLRSLLRRTAFTPDRPE